MRKFTLAEIVRLIGHLKMYAVAYHCEVCDRKKLAEMIVVTATGVPIGVCIHCATELITANSAQGNRQNAALVAASAKTVANALTKRGRPRKAAVR